MSTNLKTIGSKEAFFANTKAGNFYIDIPTDSLKKVLPILKSYLPTFKEVKTTDKAKKAGRTRIAFTGDTVYALRIGLKRSKGTLEKDGVPKFKGAESKYSRIEKERLAGAKKENSVPEKKKVAEEKN